MVRRKATILNKSLDLDSGLAERALFEFDKGIRLFELKADDLKSFVSAGDALSIIVFYDIGNGCERITLIFKQRSKKKTVFQAN